MPKLHGGSREVFVIEVNSRRVKVGESASNGTVIPAGRFAMDVIVKGAMPRAYVLAEEEALALCDMMVAEAAKIRRSLQSRAAAKKVAGLRDAREVTNAIVKVLEGCLVKSGLTYVRTWREWSQVPSPVALSLLYSIKNDVCEISLYLKVGPDQLIGHYQGSEYKEFAILSADPEMESKISALLVDVKESLAQNTERVLRVRAEINAGAGQDQQL